MAKDAKVLYGADGNLRSGWRFAIFIAIFILAYTFFLSVAVVAFQGFGITSESGQTTVLVVHGLIALAIALVVAWLCGKYLEKLPFEALGAAFKNRWIINLLIGLIGGMITFAIGAGVGVLFGGLSFSFNAEASTNSIISTLLISFVVFAVAAAFEEALFRGYILQTFVRSGLAWPAIIITSIAFGAVHLGNPNASVISSLNTALAGIWFSVAYLKTRDLWFPFGLHLAWNWTQGSIFGVEVSGLTDIVKSPLLRETDVGPLWLTGGDYGIEGGIATTVALIVSTVLIHFLPLLERKGNAEVLDQ
jgi:membrane protease YdiL (CAAX protease family)